MTSDLLLLLVFGVAVVVINSLAQETSGLFGHQQSESTTSSTASTELAAVRNREVSRKIKKREKRMIGA